MNIHDPFSLLNYQRKQPRIVKQARMAQLVAPQLDDLVIQVQTSLWLWVYQKINKIMAKYNNE